MAYTTIKKPSDYFNTKLYTGNGTAIGSGGNAITGVGFQPDFTWIKDRFDSNNYSHILTNSVSGAGKNLFSNLANVEETNTERLNSFDSDGFTVGSNVGVNTNSSSYVAWSWLGGGTASSNTDGSITSTVSANTTSGFSIVSYTGNGSASATVGHGLGAVPELIIGKNRIASNRQWMVKHKDLTAGNYTVNLNLTNAQFSPGDATYDLGDSSKFGFTTASNVDNVNLNTNTFIAYCFKSVQGFSKIGSYTGNASANGPFVYTGFKPAFVMVKNINSATADWTMFDVKRNTYNIMDKRLRANLGNAEDAPLGFIDFTSNGFKWRTDSFAVNGSGHKMIYMAFAEEPLVGDNPATAR